METPIIIPKGGMGTTEGTVVAWLKKVGDTITAGEVIVEIETAKAVEELEAQINGKLSQIVVNEDETVEVHSIIGYIEHDE